LIIISVSEEIQTSQYSVLLYLGASFSIVMLLACLFYAKKGLKLSLFYTALCFSSFYWWAYSKADKFYELAQVGEFLKVSYVSPVSDQLIPLSDIASVTFGTNTRGAKTCFISLNTKSGEKFRSANLPEDTQYCKDIRVKLMDLLMLS